MTVARLEAEMPCTELVDWMAFFDIAHARQNGIPDEHKQMSGDEVFAILDRMPRKN